MWQILVLLILLALMAGLGFVVPEGGGTPSLALAATGFILLAAWTSGTLFRRINLPALLGYLAAGILFGPKLAHIVFGDAGWALFGDGVIEQLALINTMAVGVIGTIGGGELKISDLKRGFKETLAITIACFVVTLPLVTGLVLLIARFLPGWMPFLDGLAFEHHLAVALLLAILACGMSPAATIAILQDVKARGSFTTLVLGIVVVADLALVALFLVLVAVAQTLVSPEGFQLAGLVKLAPAILAEFGWALVIGAAAGGLFILYLRFVKRELLLFAVGMIFAVSFVSQALHAETLLAFLTAGFVVQNLSRHGHTLIHALEEISLPVFVVYFMTQAASLNLVALEGYLPLTLALVAARTLIFYGSIRFGAKLAKASEDSQRYLWMCFFSQGGVDLVLAAIIAQRIPQWGVEVQTIVTATVITYIIGGPPLLKLALERVGETAEARERQQRQAAHFESAAQSGEGTAEEEATFQAPVFEDATLQATLEERLEALRQVITAELVASSRSAATLARSCTAQLEEAVAELLASSAPPREAHRRFLLRLQPVFDGLPPALPLNEAAMERTLEAVQTLEPFQTVLQVPREASTWEPAAEDGRMLAWVKQGRRLRTWLAGPGERSVPLGRLWRFYVALELPQQLARQRYVDWAVWWREVSLLLSHVEAYIAAQEAEEPSPVLATLSRIAQARLQAERAAAEATPVADDHADHAAIHAPADEAPPIDEVAALREALAATQATLREATLTVEALPARLERAAARAWNQLLGATRRAGGWELPSFNYSPSRAFDRARGARSSLREQLEAAAREATATRDDLILARAVVLTERFYQDFARGASRSFGQALSRRALGALQRSVDHVNTALERVRAAHLPDGTPAGEEALREQAWRSWLHEVALPQLHETALSLQHTAERADLRTHTQRRLQSLDRFIATLPDALMLAASLHPKDRPDQILPRFELHAWLYQEVSAEVALALDDGAERLRQTFLATLEELAQLAPILRYYALTAQQASSDEADEERGEDVAPLEAIQGALERARDRLERARSKHAEAAQLLEQHLHRVLQELLDAALVPLASRDVEAVRRQLARRAAPVRPSPSLAALLVQARSGAIALKDRVQPELAREWDQLAAALQQAELESPRPLSEAVDDAERHDLETLPVYRRLFTRLHLDVHQLQLALPELEVGLRHELERWRAGAPLRLLLIGEPGHPPASLAQTILAPQIDSERLHIAAFDLEDRDEAAWVRALQPPGGHRLESFEQLLRLLRSRDQPLLIVLDGVEQAFLPTRARLELARGLLCLIEATAESVGWILPITAPLLSHLDPLLRLQDRSTSRLEVPRLSAEVAERFFRARHQLSGYRLQIEAPTWSLTERALSPLLTRSASQEPERFFFERLINLSAGRLGEAAHLWLQQAMLSGEEHGETPQIRLRPLPRALPALTRGLSPEALVLALALVRHGRLEEATLPELLRLTPAAAARALLELRGAHLLAPLHTPGLLVLRPSALYGVTRGLRARGLIA